MISKEKFVEIINKLKEIDGFIKETNEKARQLNDAVISDFFNASSLSISHETIVIELLENIFEEWDVLSWWIYELDYGRKYTDGCISDKNGNVIDLSTAEKLYDYLVKGE